MCYGYRNTFGIPRPIRLKSSECEYEVVDCNMRASGLTLHCSARHNTAMLSKELVAASTVPLVLSVLSKGETYGYELIQNVRELSDGRIEWTEGMLYPVLHWMERERMIESEWREVAGERRRKYYRLRKEGRAALKE